MSTKALAVALKEAGVIEDADVVHLSRFVVPAKQKLDPELVNLSDRALVRKRELLERGLSSYYVGLCFEAVSKELISARRAAEMMLIDDFELPEIAALFGVKL